MNTLWVMSLGLYVLAAAAQLKNENLGSFGYHALAIAAAILGGVP
jgi:hypothetical protein